MYWCMVYGSKGRVVYRYLKLSNINVRYILGQFVRNVWSKNRYEFAWYWCCQYCLLYKWALELVSIIETCVLYWEKNLIYKHPKKLDFLIRNAYWYQQFYGNVTPTFDSKFILFPWFLHPDDVRMEIRAYLKKKKYYQVWQEVSNDGSSDRTHDFPRGK